MSLYTENTTVEQWEATAKTSFEKPILLLKHSTTCPISAEAHKQFQAFLEEHASDHFQSVLVKVIESRDVSNAIAEELRVKHESPQAILIKDGRALWDASHWDISKRSLEESVLPHLT